MKQSKSIHRSSEICFYGSGICGNTNWKIQIIKESYGTSIDFGMKVVKVYNIVDNMSCMMRCNLQPKRTAVLVNPTDPNMNSDTEDTLTVNKEVLELGLQRIHQ